MATSDFRVRERFQTFRDRAVFSKVTDRRPLLFLAGWFSFFVLLSLPFDLSGFHTALLIVYCFFWLKSTEWISRELKPPGELLLLSLAFIASLTVGFLHLRPSQENPVWVTVQLTLLALWVLFLGVIVVRNTAHPKRFLLFGLLVFYLCINLLKNGSNLNQVVVQVILFVVLLRKTAWLEELTKAEMWIGLFLVLVLLEFVAGLRPQASVLVAGQNATLLWYELPLALYFAFKMYLLVVLIKIPIVLVYNFASLSRKLSISSYFQSTVPQIIQLVMLLIIFYFFVAGWQAEKVRLALLNEMEKVFVNDTSLSAQYFKVWKSSPDTTYEISGYEPISLPEALPERGVLALRPAEITSDSSTTRKAREFFIFSNIREDDEEIIYFVKLDSSFLSQVSQNTAVLAGTHLQAYPYTPTIVESYLYNLNFLVGDRGFKIFPFGFISWKDRSAISAPIKQVEYSLTERTRRFNLNVNNVVRLVTGRVITPLHDAKMHGAGYFVFDILLYPSMVYFTPTLLGYIALLTALYMLLNFLVIRRMVKFGSEINSMIVQKFKHLKDGIREISSGNLNYKVRLEGQDEFVELAERFNQMGDKLKESIDEVREKERLEHELTIARKVQLDLLPRFLPQIPGFNIAAMFKTATEVGGDFYDILPLRDDQYLFTIGDVSGKGTSAAFYMAQCISLIRYSPQFTDNPVEIARRLNKYFSDPMIDLQVFVTAIVGTIDAKNNCISFVRAGHAPPVHIPGKRSESICELKPPGLGLGLERQGRLFEKNLQFLRVELAPNDKILFYTDGFVEASVASSEGGPQSGRTFYGEERLLEILEEHREKDAVALMKVLEKDIEAFYAGSALHDDYTMLLVQKSP